MFLCIPIVYSCGAKLSQEGHDTRNCPRCNNATVEPVKRKRRFDLCYVPLIPLGTKHLWYCPTCHWEAKRGEGAAEPQPAHGGGGQFKPAQFGNGGGGGAAAPPAGRGYDVGYGGGAKPAH